jgi:diguanylate cyclase (GGDEF)-like protein/PAS domain S-box-containing protein
VISPVAYLDTKFNFIFVNQAYAAADQQDVSYFPAKNHFALYPNPENQQIFQQVVASGKPYKCFSKPFEYAEHPERGLTYWDWELNPIKDESGDTQGLLLSLSDVTGRIKAQEEISRNLLNQEIIASILRLSLKPLPFKEILRQSLVMALQSTDLPLSYKGVIFLVNPETDELEMAVRHGLPDSIVTSCARIRRGECVCGSTFAEEKLIFTSCIDEQHSVTYQSMSPHGHYCAPIKSDGEMLGVLNLYVEHGHQSSDVEVQFVAAIADTLAGVILREQASQALQESELRYRSITETAQDAIITISRDGNIISWNRGATLIFGYTHDEAIGRPVTILIPARFHERHERAIEEWKNIGSSTHSDSPMEVSGLRKDGTEIVLEILLSSWVVEDKDHITGIVRDISRRKMVESLLRQAKVVFDNAMEGIVVTDAESCIISVNRAISDITGYSKDELLGKRPNIWKSDHHDSSFYHAMWLQLEQSGSWCGEIWNRQKNGELFPCWQTIRVIKDELGKVVSYISIMSDISIIKASQQKMEYLAHHDALTGLPNRILFQSRLEHAMNQASREGDMIAVLFIDLDRFKHINDSYGHSVGDKVLQEVARRLQNAIRKEDTVARIGGDEFPIMLEKIQDISEVQVVVDKLLGAFVAPIELPQQELHVSPSIGISLFPRDAHNYTTLLRNADTAMYQAKATGRNTYQFYSANHEPE